MAADNREVLRERVARIVDDHAFDSDRWGCACGHRPDSSDLNVLREHRTHVADAVLDALGLEQVDHAWLTVKGLCNHGSWDWCGRTDHEVEHYWRVRTT